MTKIKVAHVQVLPILSGVQNISLEIFSALDNDIYEKYLFCSDDVMETKEFTRRFEEQHVKIVRLPSLKRELGRHDWTAIKDFYRIFLNGKFDVVHTHSSKPGVVARIAARLAGIPFVVHTVHGVAFHANEPLLKRFVFFAAEFFASLFGHYVTSVNGYYSKYFRYLRHFQIIYNGVDTQVDEVERSVEKFNRRILYLSRLERAKDPMTLLAAVLILREQYRREDFFLTVAGDGELMENARKYVVDNQLDECVEFLGWVEAKEQVYSNADIFCVPSIFEAFGLVFAEAGLYGLPTVSTNVEGIPEVVLDGKTGFLVESKRPEKLAEKLNYLLDNPDVCLRLGAEARKLVISRFGKEKMTREYIELYEKNTLIRDV